MVQFGQNIDSFSPDCSTVSLLGTSSLRSLEPSRSPHNTTPWQKKSRKDDFFFNKKKVAARHSALANAELPPSRPPTSVARPTTAGDCQNVDHHADHVDHHQSLQDLGLDQLSCPLMEWSTERRLSALKLSKAIPTGKCGLVLKLNSLFFTVASRF